MLPVLFEAERSVFMQESENEWRIQLEGYFVVELDKGRGFW
jgi:hypothetical protein